MRAISLSLLPLVAALFLACGGTPRERKAREMADVIEDMTGVLAEIRDEASAKAATSKLEGFAKQLSKLAEEGKELGEPSKEEKESLMKIMKEPMEAMQKEMMRVMVIPGASKALGKALSKMK